MIKPLYSILVSLLRPALGVQQATPPQGLKASQWREVYDLAAKHNVQGLLQASLSSVPAHQGANLPLDVAAHLLSDSVAIEADHQRHRIAAARMAVVWAEKGIDARMIKGLESAKYYPKPETRVLGDIDWWIVRPEDWDKAIEAVRAMGLKPEKDSDGDIHYEFDGIIVEHHRKGPRLPGAQGELELLGEHVLHHAAVFGAELRHICDYAVARGRLRTSVTAPRKGMRKWWEVIDSLSDYIITGKEPSPDAARLLEMTLGGSTAAERASFFLRIAPGPYMERLLGLAVGRIKRIF